MVRYLGWWYCVRERSSVGTIEQHLQRRGSIKSQSEPLFIGHRIATYSRIDNIRLP